MIKYPIILFTLSFILTSCNQKEEKETLLMADREAPLGWVYLRIYKDNTFEFESRGLERRGNIYNGSVKIINDTLHFKYLDSIPKPGTNAILSKNSVSYFGGEYPETLIIKKNLLKTE
jgi:hypothetical protein